MEETSICYDKCQWLKRLAIKEENDCNSGQMKQEEAPILYQPYQNYYLRLSGSSKPIDGEFGRTLSDQRLKRIEKAKNCNAHQDNTMDPIAFSQCNIQLTSLLVDYTNQAINPNDIPDQENEIQPKSQVTRHQRRSARLSALTSSRDSSESQKMKTRRNDNESRTGKKLSKSRKHRIQRAEVGYSYNGPFKRFHGSIDDYKMRGPFKNAINRRKKTVNRLILDENVFQGLGRVKEWDEEKMIPSLDQMTPCYIKRIKKGMANGRLYNLGYHHIQKIFPNLSSSPFLATNGNHRGSARFKCPMCSSSYEHTCQVHEHIESDHTTSLISCEQCESLFTTHNRLLAHQCSKLKRKPKPKKNGKNHNIHLRAIELWQEKNCDPMHNHGTKGKSPSKLANIPSLTPEKSPLINSTKKTGMEMDQVSYFAEESSLMMDGDEKIFRGDHADAFKRYFGELDGFKVSLQRMSIIRRRQISARNLILDGKYFKNLNRVDDWSIDDPVPAEAEITSNDIKRIKKGMMNGKLYNMGYHHIQRIFPSFSIKIAKTVRGRRIRCPLCCKLLHRGSLHNHIECFHTMSLIICLHCKCILTSKLGCYLHRCPGKRDKTQGFSCRS